MSVALTTAEKSALDVELYRRLALIRRFEELAYRAYEAGEIAGTIHASIGQEAVAVGAIAALRRDDVVFTHHRGHGHALAKGVDPSRLFAELLGRAHGVSGGKGGSMHATDVDVGFFGSYAVVGGSIPLAVGVGAGRAPPRARHGRRLDLRRRRRQPGRPVREPQPRADLVAVRSSSSARTTATRSACPPSTRRAATASRGAPRASGSRAPSSTARACTRCATR